MSQVSIANRARFAISFWVAHSHRCECMRGDCRETRLIARGGSDVQYVGYFQRFGVANSSGPGLVWDDGFVEQLVLKSKQGY